MTLRFASLGSGSSGNATIVASRNSALLIDCGFSVKECEARLAALNFSPESLSAILVTHEHGDHAKGVRALARKYHVPVFMSHGTMLACDQSGVSELNTLCSEQKISIGDFVVHPVTVPHDAREPLQFVVEVDGLRLGVLTDLGSYTPAVVSAYSGCDALLVEANHDVEMLARGPYPYSLQKRVRGPWGHLNNHQTAALLHELDLSKVQHLVIGHISEKNNCVERVLSTLDDVLGSVLGNESGNGMNTIIATQDTGFAWVDIRV